jgi:hypothetical protein
MCKDGGVKGKRVASCFWASSYGGAGCGAFLGVVGRFRFEAYSTAFASFEKLFLVLRCSIGLD